ncbi:hypothetical protein C8R44DRAFT_769119 [Mycena epipterygia]|nr:hypothetical protein C8R44DRAFT_769119 [Mycena epipterygia]
MRDVLLAAYLHFLPTYLPTLPAPSIRCQAVRPPSTARRIKLFAVLPSEFTSSSAGKNILGALRIPSASCGG